MSVGERLSEPEASTTPSNAITTYISPPATPMASLPRGAALSLVLSDGLAWMAVAALHAAVVAARLGGDGDVARVEGHILGDLCVLAAPCLAATAAWHTWAEPSLPRPRLARFSGHALLATILAFVLVRPDLSGVAGRLSEATALPFTLVISPLVVLCALPLPIGAWLAQRLRGPLVRALVAVASVGAVIAHALVLPGAYPGLHLVVAVTAAWTMAGMLRGVAPHGRAPRLAGALLLAGFTAGAAGGLFIAPRMSVRLRLLGQPAALLTPFPRWFEPTPLITDAGAIPRGQDAWFRSRVGAPDVPSTQLAPLRGPIVILLGIDSLRADVLANERRRGALPNLFKLRDASVSFSEARSPGSSTAPVFAAIFSGRYFSQLYWDAHPGRPGEVFPHKDMGPRFPERLRAADIPSINRDTTGWLIEKFGIVRGFTDEKSLRVRGYPRSDTVLPELTARILEHKEGPLFAFTHVLDAHSPYKSATTKGSPYKRYIAALGLVDRQLGILKNALVQAGLWERTILIVMSDHGEAFGEHESRFHGQTLYEELVRVPLLFRVPGVSPRRIDAPVSLIDLGPTILDLLDLPTPGSYMGQSLVPAILGRSFDLTRPIVAEAQLKCSMLLPDGTKVIRDRRMNLIEAYDLRADPKELNDLYDPSRAASVVGPLDRFMKVHTYAQPGYTVPFRRW
jgi:hypothetical protein